jgi:hypothetical protein
MGAQMIREVAQKISDQAGEAQMNVHIRRSNGRVMGADRGAVDHGDLRRILARGQRREQHLPSAALAPAISARRGVAHAGHDDYRAGQGRDCVEIGSQHGCNFRDENNILSYAVLLHLTPLTPTRPCWEASELIS